MPLFRRKILLKAIIIVMIAVLRKLFNKNLKRKLLNKIIK